MRSLLAFIILAVILSGCGRDSGRLNDPNHILTIDELTADTVDRWSHPLAELDRKSVV